MAVFQPEHAQARERIRQRVDLEIAVLKEATQVIVEKHYLHRGRTMAQIAYWISLDGERCGVLLFALPRMSARSEKFGGRGPMNMIELARMWLEPSVQGLRHVDRHGREHAFPVATAAVSKALRRIQYDWHGKYPHLPDITACVSWADEIHHEGTIYRAANFKEVGRSGGLLHGNAHRSTGGRDQLHPDYLHMKRAFLFDFGAPLSNRRKRQAEVEWEELRPRRPIKPLVRKRDAENGRAKP